MIKKLITLFIILIFLTGCWDNKDVTKQGLVVGMGIDKGKNKHYKLTLQIAKPTASTSTDGKNNIGEPYWTHSTEGDTIFEAIRNQATTISRRPFFSHNQIFIISEDIAKEELSSLLDLIYRDTEMRLNYKILITKDISSEQILNLKSDLELLPSIHISEIMNNIESTNKLISVTAFDIINKSSEYGFNSTIGVIKPKENVKKAKTMQDIIVEGAAIFSNDKLIGWLDDKETESLQFISNINKDSMQGLLINHKNDNAKIKTTIELIKLNSSIDVKVINGKLKVFINTKAKGALGEQQSKSTLSVSKNLKLLEKLTEDEVKSEMENIIYISQKKYKSDFIGIFEYVRKKEPEYFKKVKNNWNQIYSKIDFTVNVDIEIDNAGLTQQQIITK